MRRKHIGLSSALAGLVAAAVAAPLAGAAGATRTVATSQTVDFRATLVATRISGGSAPAARASLKLFRHAAGGWRPISTRPLPGTYFWKSLTGPRAVCRLEISTVGGAGGATGHVTVQLLETPSLGCAQPRTFALPAD